MDDGNGSKGLTDGRFFKASVKNTALKECAIKKPRYLRCCPMEKEFQGSWFDRRVDLSGRGQDPRRLDERRKWLIPLALATGT